METTEVHRYAKRNHLSMRETPALHESELHKEHFDKARDTRHPVGWVAVACLNYCRTVNAHLVELNRHHGRAEIADGDVEREDDAEGHQRHPLSLAPDRLLLVARRPEIHYRSQPVAQHVESGHLRTGRGPEGNASCCFGPRDAMQVGFALVPGAVLKVP